MSGAPHAFRAAALGLAALLAALLTDAEALAQFGGPPAASPPPSQPPTSAAGGLEEEQKPQTIEAQLPEDPLALPPAVRKRIGTDADPDVDKGRGDKTTRRFYGLYYDETSGKYRFRTVFPLWAERTMPNDRISVFSPLYVQRRSQDVDYDVAFPFFWNVREGGTRTKVVGPVVRRTLEGRPAAPGRKAEPSGHDNWVAPLFFEGSRSDGSGYLHVPPLLTFTSHTARSGFNLVGPLYCSWKGGPACDTRSADEISFGLAPFYFYDRDEDAETELIPPLLHYYRYSDKGDASFNLWGPFLWEKHRKGEVFNVLPFFWRNWGKNEDHTTLFPFFHYGWKGNARLLVTPLFLSARGEKGETTFASPLYSRYRGRTELDMVTPLYWHYRDPDIGLDRKLLFPFFYRNTSPRSNDVALFPFYAHFEKPAISETTWVTPLFRHTTDLTGWETDIYPFFYSGRTNRSTHLVLAPLFWDFATPKSRATVALPAYFRFADEESVSQLALNTYYHEKRVRGGREWEFHLFPAFSYGESPQGHWWNILYGLVGYSREGRETKIRALYLPFTVSGSEPPKSVEVERRVRDGDTELRTIDRLETR